MPYICSASGEAKGTAALHNVRKVTQHCQTHRAKSHWVLRVVASGLFVLTVLAELSGDLTTQMSRLKA